MTLQGGVMNRWSAGTFETHGAILAKWNSWCNGSGCGVAGPLGLPTSSEGQTDRVNGRYSRFEGGVINYNPRVNGAFVLYGGILNKFATLGYSNHPLGLPVSDRIHNEVLGNDYQLFDDGAINQYGGNAFETHGAIFARWNVAGAAFGVLGLPTTDEYPTLTSPQGTTGRYERFQRGVINYNPKINAALVLRGNILAKYESLGFAAGYLGLPTSEEYPTSGGTRQNFEGGFITDELGAGTFVDPGAPPQVGVSEIVSPVSGRIKVRRKGAKRFVRLRRPQLFKDGSEVDATRGTVDVTVATSRTSLETATLSSGQFVIDQAKGTNPLTSFRLSKPLSCAAAARTKGRRSRYAFASRRKPPKGARKNKRRHLWAQTKKGHFRTDGKYAAGTVKGTRWHLTDRCDSTTVSVQRGRVSVYDKVRRTESVSAGGSYTARAQYARACDTTALRVSRP